MSAIGSPLGLRLYRLEVVCKCKVMRTEGGGIDIYFFGLSAQTKRALRLVVRDQYPLH